MASVPTKRKLQVWEEAGWKCRWCGCHLVRVVPHDGVQFRPGEVKQLANMATVDHLEPILRTLRKRGVKGGSVTKRSNLVAACWECNSRRGAEMIKGLRNRVPPGRMGKRVEAKR